MVIWALAFILLKYFAFSVHHFHLVGILILFTETHTAIEFSVV